MRHLLLYGTSIFLAGLAAELQTLPTLHVRCQSTLSDLGDLAFLDAVIVDLNDPCAGEALTLLRARPTLKIVGVNAPGSSVTILSGQVYLAQTLSDILAHLY